MRIVLFGDIGKDVTLPCVVRALRARDASLALTLVSSVPHATPDLGQEIVPVADARANAAIAAADLVIVVGDALWTDATAWSPSDLFDPHARSPIAAGARPLLMAAAFGIRSALFAGNCPRAGIDHP